MRAERGRERREREDRDRDSDSDSDRDRDRDRERDRDRDRDSKRERARARAHTHTREREREREVVVGGERDSLFGERMLTYADVNTGLPTHAMLAVEVKSHLDACERESRPHTPHALVA